MACAIFGLRSGSDLLFLSQRFGRLHAGIGLGVASVLMGDDDPVRLFITLGVGLFEIRRDQAADDSQSKYDGR